MESPHWGRLLAGPVDLWGTTLKQSVPEGLCHIGAVHEELQPVRGTHIGAVHGELSPVGGIPHWSKGRM